MAIYQDNRPLIHRMQWFRFAIIAVFLLLGLKLWHLSIVRHEYYETRAEHNQIRTIPLVAPRGLVTDRDGNVLIENISSFSLFLYRDQTEDLDSTRGFLIDEIGLDAALLDERLNESRQLPAFKPILVGEQLDLQQLAFFLAHQIEHPELRIFEQPQRRYRFNHLAAHVLGYVGEISKRELNQLRFQEAKPGTVIGKSGVERVYNQELTGRNGHRAVLVTSYGKVIEEINRVPPSEGNEIQLTLDSDLQEVAARELAGRPGAVLAFNPQNGAILAMSSSPAYDPNLFAARISSGEWKKLIENPDKPLQNRVIQSTFSPGSIFKLIIALAGMERGLIDENTSVYCSGSVELYGHRFRCWHAGGHGRVRLKEAIQHSCNVYFYLLGTRLGIEQISRFSHQVGLGSKTGIELPGEVEGLVPSREWKREVRGAPWYDGETVSVAIGQGPLDVTPIQLARAIGMVATGKAVNLHLRTSEGGFPRRVGFDPKNLALIRDAMWSVVNEWGTGKSARVEGLDVCGKTGTVQTISTATKEKLSEEAQARFEPHGWFVGFAPRDNPELVVAVIAQKGGGGGSSAAPIAGRVFQAYYDKYRPSEPTAPIQVAELEQR